MWLVAVLVVLVVEQMNLQVRRAVVEQEEMSEKLGLGLGLGPGPGLI